MPRRKPYHHGHLRKALLGAAIELIATVGSDGFTLREITRRAGVSHNAPYRHFRSKEDLIAAVAAQGFRELDQALRAAAQGIPGPRDRLKASLLKPRTWRIAGDRRAGQCSPWRRLPGFSV